MRHSSKSVLRHFIAAGYPCSYIAVTALGLTVSNPTARAEVQAIADQTGCVDQSLGCLSRRALASGGVKGYFSSMTDKQAVVDALQRLPENASLEEITEELHIMAAVRRGRADVVAGRTKTHEEAQALLESWATAWTSR
jgi:predicted transcriptional regulator